jgi:ATP-dependent helicase HrpB
MDSRQSAATRILIVTEAIFVSTILGDPELTGISAVLFDEAHERHLDSDLGLALAIECQQVLREDLRIVPMSATIDGGRFAGLLGADVPVIERGQGLAARHPLAGRGAGQAHRRGDGRGDPDRVARAGGRHSGLPARRWRDRACA